MGGAGPEGRLASQVQAWIPANPVATALPHRPPSPLWLFQGTQPKLEGAAYSHDSFNCFCNLKIKVQPRHLQGDACFIKGICSQQAQGWTGVAGWALEYFPGPLPRALTLVSRVPFSLLQPPFLFSRRGTSQGAGRQGGGLDQQPGPQCVMRRPGPRGTCPPCWHCDTIPGVLSAAAPRRCVRKNWGGRRKRGRGREKLGSGWRGGAERRGRGTSPCPQRESVAAGGHPAWADSPGKAGTRAWSRSSPPSAPASPHGNQAQQHIRAVRGG